MVRKLLFFRTESLYRMFPAHHDAVFRFQRLNFRISEVSDEVDQLWCGNTCFLSFLLFLRFDCRATVLKHCHNIIKSIFQGPSVLFFFFCLRKFQHTLVFKLFNYKKLPLSR